MWEFEIVLRSVQDVQEFVALATKRSFAVQISDGRHRVNGKSFMEMFCLDFTRPLKVSVRCDEVRFDEFRADALRFLAQT